MSYRIEPVGLFIENADAEYEFFVRGRIAEYAVSADDLYAAVRRARLTPEDVMIEDRSGHRTALPAR